MKPDKTTLFQLFDPKRRFVIPLFQRGYVWERETQWLPLWEDIVDQGEQALSGTAAGQASSHFMGAVVLHQAAPGVNYVPVIEVIDGQQRLTTLLVVLCALRDETTETGDEFIRSELERLTKNPEPLKLPHERFKVWPTAAYRKEIEDITGAGSLQELIERNPAKLRYGKWDPPRPKLVEAYEFFAESIRTLIASPDSERYPRLADAAPSQRVEAIHQALTRKLQIVTIELEAGDDPQVIFETLNARGVPLQAADLIRNFVFLEALRRGEDVERLYGEFWRTFDELRDPNRPSKYFWREEERQGRLKRSRLDLYLFHLTTVWLGEVIKVEQIYDKFKSHWDKTYADTQSGLQDVRQSSGIYYALLHPDRDTRFGRFAHRLRVLDTTTIYPLIIWLAGRLGLSSKEMTECVEVLESYVLRRAVCLLPQNSYNRLFMRLLSDLRSSENPPSAKRIAELLSAHEGESALWPSDERFRTHLCTDATYDVFRPRQTQLLLEALDEAARAAYGEKILIASELSVEHVQPQNGLEEDWPLEIRSDESEEEARARRSRLIHNLGNLTLLTKPLNSHVGRGPYELKRPEIAKQSSLALNSYFQSQMSWTQADIQTRASKLADEALRLWGGPRPAP